MFPGQHISLLWLRFLVCVLSLLALPAAADFNRAVQNFAAERYTAALEEFHHLASLGHQGSQFNLGAMHFLGQGVPQDSVEAYGWIALAADNDDVTSRTLRDRVWARLNEGDRARAHARAEELGERYGQEHLQQNLLPVIHDTEPLFRTREDHPNEQPVYPKRALGLRMNGAVDVEFFLDQQGYLAHYSVLASSHKLFNSPTLAAIKSWRFEPDPMINTATPVVSAARIYFRTGPTQAEENARAKALQQLRLKAEAGEASDMFDYAWEGLLSSALSPAQATGWYVKAAQAGFPRAQYQLGHHLTYGIGCERDLAKARRWLTIAAESGMPAAQYLLAMQLFADEPETAIAWLERAVAARHPVAMAEMAWLLATHEEDAQRDGGRALSLIKSLIEDYPDALTAKRILAASEAANGDFVAAIKTQEEVLALTASLKRPLDIEEQRLAAYRAEQPWREARPKEPLKN